MMAAFIINLALVSLVVMIHYESLERLSRIMPHLRLRHRSRIVVGLLGAIIAHVVEIWVFAVAYYLMIYTGRFGHLGNPEPDILNCAYFSFVTYTTLGYGDIAPVGSLRFLAGLEALTELVLITWTASFMYLQIQQYWSNQK